jgi:hypothetical protein
MKPKQKIYNPAGAPLTPIPKGWKWPTKMPKRNELVMFRFRYDSSWHGPMEGQTSASFYHDCAAFIGAAFAPTNGGNQNE